MRDEALSLYARMKQLHEDFYKELLTLRAQTKNPRSLEEIADTVFILKKTHELSNDLRKELDGATKLFEKLACLLVTQLNHFDTIRGELTSATPKCKMAVNFPSISKDPEAYYDFCAALGIDRELASKEVFRLHWPGVSDYLSDLQAKGEKLPEGIDPDKTYPIYSLVCQPARGVSIDEKAGLETRKEK